ncbi:MAG: vanadium-dependent haloperoxidase [Solirubrobacteraceae bacterium]
MTRLAALALAALAAVSLASFALAATAAGLTPPKRHQVPARHRHRHHASAATAQPDQVLEWNQNLLQLLQIPGAQPATIHPTRTMAITQLAVYGAVHTADRANNAEAAQPAAEAAAASAAHTALDALLPSQQPAIDAKFQDSLTQIGAGRRIDRGIRIGIAAADAILAARANDGATATPPPYVPQPGPGEYQLTPPNFQPPVFTHWAAVTPFVMRSAGQFRPAPPPAVTSPRYTDDFNEVKSLGQSTSASRSAEQTQIGRFWGAGPVQNVWNQIAEMAAGALHTSLAQNARLFAVLDTTLADGVIALYDAKYAYHRWRPVTAIQAGENDGNPATAGDPAWTPLANTALDPSYPGAHAEISQSAAAALQSFFGTDRVDFSLSNPALPGVVRSFQSFSQAAQEASASRIYAGQHFRYDEDAGQALGDQVGDFVADRLLRHAHRHSGRL